MTIPHNKYRLQVISIGLQLYFCTRNDAADPQDPSHNLIEIIASKNEEWIDLLLYQRIMFILRRCHGQSSELQNLIEITVWAIALFFRLSHR